MASDWFIRSTVAAGLLLGACCWGMPASGKTATFTPATPDSAAVRYAPPFVSVTVDRTSTANATLIFTSQSNSTGTGHRFGATKAIDANVSRPFAVDAASGSGSSSGFQATVRTPDGTGNPVWSGVFKLRTNSLDEHTHGADWIQVELTDLVSPWDSSAGVLVATAKEHPSAARILVSSMTHLRSALAAGYVTGTDLISTLGPASLPILASGVVMLAYLCQRQWRRRRVSL